VILTELLPPTKSSRHNVLRFARNAVGQRLIEITTGRDTTQYAVVPLDTDFDGRAFRLWKIDPGTDPEASHYDVHCAPGGSSCECRGFLRHDTCRHVSACLALIENRWI
jgi:hypothetical protein